MRVWNDAVVRWLREQAHKATIEEDRNKLRWLDRWLPGACKMLIRIAG